MQKASLKGLALLPDLADLIDASRTILNPVAQRLMPAASPMLFTIITPSFNQLDYLKRCIASVADQSVAISPRPLANSDELNANCSIHVHHHVQDGGSTDGTVDWLRQYDTEVRRQQSEAGTRTSEVSSTDAPRPMPDGYTFSYESAPDNGMYDAINKGVECTIQGDGRWAAGNGKNGELKTVVGSQRSDVGGRKAEDRDQHTVRESCCPMPDAQRPPRDSVIAWLNCDEQYLPGTLSKVAYYIETNPDVDVCCGHALVVDEGCMLAGFWKAMPLRYCYLRRGYLYNLSCAMFFRSSIYEQGFRFDTAYKAIGDQEFLARLLRSGSKTGILNDYLSAYTFSAGNLSEQFNAQSELGNWQQVTGATGRAVQRIFRFLQRTERFLNGCTRQQFPLVYELYTDEYEQRNRFVGSSVSAKWPGQRGKNG